MAPSDSSSEIANASFIGGCRRIRNKCPDDMVYLGTSAGACATRAILSSINAASGPPKLWQMPKTSNCCAESGSVNSSTSYTGTV
jgi:hypothetical protein